MIGSDSACQQSVHFFREWERPEAVEAGTVKVAGVEEEDIFALASELLSDPEKWFSLFLQAPYKKASISLLAFG